jgi:hypothetical protein
MPMKLRAYLTQVKARSTPEQRLWMARILACTGGALMWRSFHVLYPSTWLAVVGLGIMAAWIGCMTRLVKLEPGLNSMLGLGMPIIIGGLMNFAVVIANGGYMPCTLTVETAGMYMPMDGARLAHLGDWIGGFVSPGDVLIVIGMVGILTAAAVRRIRRGKIAEVA